MAQHYSLLLDIAHYCTMFLNITCIAQYCSLLLNIAQHCSIFFNIDHISQHCSILLNISQHCSILLNSRGVLRKIMWRTSLFVLSAWTFMCNAHSILWGISILGCIQWLATYASGGGGGEVEGWVPVKLNCYFWFLERYTHAHTHTHTWAEIHISRFSKL